MNEMKKSQHPFGIAPETQSEINTNSAGGENRREIGDQTPSNITFFRSILRKTHDKNQPNSQ